MAALYSDSKRLGERKGRGAFFTPDAIAEHLTAWALGGLSSGTVLDPTCGDGAFLSAAEKTLSGSIGSSENFDFWGIDIHEKSLNEARSTLRTTAAGLHFVHEDFFAVEPIRDVPLVDAIVGNPPFIRFHEHRGASRELSQKVAALGGVELNGLASSWAAALVHSARFLKASGRLALVLPAELLTVSYAGPIRNWLLQRFSSVNIVLFEKLQFVDAQADVVLLLAEGSGGSEAFSLWPVKTANDLRKIKPYSQVNVRPGTDVKWSDFLLASDSRKALGELNDFGYVPLSNYFDVKLGNVTGANAFFTLTDAERLAYQLVAGRDVRRLVPSGRKFKSPVLTSYGWQQLKVAGERVWLFAPDGKNPSAAALAYIKRGEALGVDRGYKCRTRSPWWKVPLSDAPDTLFSYMSSHAPRAIANSARALQLNSMHGLYIKKPEYRQALMTQTSALVLNSGSLLAAELNGRWYGGGILKLELGETSSLPIPSHELMARTWGELQRVGLSERLSRGAFPLEEHVSIVDRALVAVASGLPTAAMEALNRGWTAQRIRRTTKG